jgi:hypothetical protein
MVSGSLIPKIISQAQTSASHSWEYGTVFEALLEYHNPSLSIFNNPFPNGKIPTVYEHQVPALRYVKPFILTDSDQLCEGNGTFISFTTLVETQPNFKQAPLQIPHPSLSPPYSSLQTPSTSLPRRANSPTSSPPFLVSPMAHCPTATRTLLCGPTSHTWSHPF